MEKLSITSPQFESDGWIPDCCAGYGEDKSPELHIEGIPAETVTLAVVMDDLLAAMDGYVVAKGKLNGVYQRKRKN